MLILYFDVARIKPRPIRVTHDIFLTLAPFVFGVE